MNDTVIKTEELLILKKKAAILDEIVKYIPDLVGASDCIGPGKAAIDLYFKNKELWVGE